MRTRVFLLSNSSVCNSAFRYFLSSKQSQTLDQSCKTDLDIWDCLKRREKISYSQRHTGMVTKLSYDVAVIQWITSSHKNYMTTRVITLWRVSVTSLTMSVSILK